MLLLVQLYAIAPHLIGAGFFEYFESRYPIRPLFSLPQIDFFVFDQIVDAIRPIHHVGRRIVHVYWLIQYAIDLPYF